MKYFSVCGFPSSRISKCSPVRSVRKSPRRSSTVTPKLTRSVSARNTVCCAKGRATATSNTVATITTLSMATILYERLPGGSHLAGQLLHPTKIGLSRAQRRNGLEMVHVSALRQPQARHVGLTQAFPQCGCRQQWVCEEHDQPFAARLVRHGRHHARVRLAQEPANALFDLEMRHHLAAELAEPRQ